MSFRFTVLFFTVTPLLWAQQTQIQGTIADEMTKQPILNAQIRFDENKGTTSIEDGSFQLTVEEVGRGSLLIDKFGFTPKKIPLQFEGLPIALGTIYLTPDLELEKTDNLITLTDADFSDDVESLSSSVGLLQATQEIGRAHV